MWRYLRKRLLLCQQSAHTTATNSPSAASQPCWRQHLQATHEPCSGQSKTTPKGMGVPICPFKSFLGTKSTSAAHDSFLTVSFATCRAHDAQLLKGLTVPVSSRCMMRSSWRAPRHRQRRPRRLWWTAWRTHSMASPMSLRSLWKCRPTLLTLGMRPSKYKLYKRQLGEHK